MIASKKHNFIFIKTMKTAGTSIELALGPHCGREDVLTPIGAKFDLERFSTQGVMARNFASPEIEKWFRKLIRKGNPKLLKAMLRETVLQRLGAHATPFKIRERVNEFWGQAFRFTVERHPYEKAISLAAMTRAGIMSTVYADHRYVGYPWYLNESKQLIVHKVMRHDRLAEDFAEVTRRLGLPAIALPHARKTDRNRAPAREQLTPAQRGFIYERCAPEFDLFGWER
jgi:hypothetical protein